MLLSEFIPLPTEYDRVITGLTLDSRKVRPGDLFLALTGTQTHGEIYIPAALTNGAVAILKESKVASLELLNHKIPCLGVPNLSSRLGALAAHFYHYPSAHLQVIGVTGTNGKTSTTHFIAQILHAQAPCGLIGTLGIGTYGALQPSLHTTPDAIDLQTSLAQLKAQNVQRVVMEVSSHALVQHRVDGINFQIAVLTNLSRDHLDYHQTMSAYGEAKRKLFLMSNTAVINYDDEFGKSVLASLPAGVTPLTYSQKSPTADLFANIQQRSPQGYQLEIHSPWGTGVVHSPLWGQFNISNVLAALTVLLSLGEPFAKLLPQLSTLRPVAGRMERFGQPPQPTVIVDYAHTPDALQQTLSALREHCQGQLWCVFGCGGNRDQGKRPLMGEVAQRYADRVILTDDNPRHESSQAIIQDLRQGCPNPTAVITDRRQAIHYALQHATTPDVILIAGKGHEDYQQIGDQRLPFSDRSIVKEWLSRQPVK